MLTHFNLNGVSKPHLENNAEGIYGWALQNSLASASGVSFGLEVIARTSDLATYPAIMILILAIQPVNSTRLDTDKFCQAEKALGRRRRYAQHDLNCIY